MSDMNALELADHLDKPLSNGELACGLNHHTAKTLREQHTLIEALQKALREVPNTQLQYADHIRRQHEAIQKLREALRTSAAALEVRSAFGDADLASATLEATKDFVK